MSIIYLIDLEDELRMQYDRIKCRAKQYNVPLFKHKSMWAISEENLGKLKDAIKNPKAGAFNEPWIEDFLAEAREEAKKKKIKYKEIAEYMGVHSSRASSVLNNNKNLTMQNAEKIAHALGMKPVLCLMEIDE